MFPATEDASKLGISNDVAAKDSTISNSSAPGVIKASYANFGFIPYGHTMVSKLIKKEFLQEDLVNTLSYFILPDNRLDTFITIHLLMISARISIQMNCFSLISLRLLRKTERVMFKDNLYLPSWWLLEEDAAL